MKRSMKIQMNQFVAACEKVARYQLCLCSSGNLSWRIGHDSMLIKGSRAWMAEMLPEQVSLCRISDGKPLNKIQPSVEIGFHSGILRERPDMNVVLHFQTPYATMIACRRGRGSFAVLPEIPFYIGDVAYVPFLLPGSEALAGAVIKAMKSHDMTIMRNHGQVTVGRTFNEVIQKAVFFELACRILVCNGSQSVRLSARDVRNLGSV